MHGGLFYMGEAGLGRCHAERRPSLQGSQETLGQRKPVQVLCLTAHGRSSVWGW